MKSVRILLLAFFLFLTESLALNPVSYSDYNTPEALISYLTSNTYYYTSNSLFFQFDWYISRTEVNQILYMMDNIYNKYKLNGVFLILDINAGIYDMNVYTNQLCKNLENKMGFKKDNTYVAIIQYNVGTYGYPWSHKFTIDTLGDYAKHYLPNNETTTIIDNWGPYLNYYTYGNIKGLINDISDAMDKHANDPWGISTGIIILIVVIVLIVICGVGGGIYYYYYKKRSNKDTNDMSDGILSN